MAESLPWQRRTEGGREGQGLAGDASGSMKKREAEGSFGDGGREGGGGGRVLNMDECWRAGR